MRATCRAFQSVYCANALLRERACDSGRDNGSSLKLDAGAKWRRVVFHFKMVLLMWQVFVLTNKKS
jgi:hypothetical protein